MTYLWLISTIFPIISIGLFVFYSKRVINLNANKHLLITRSCYSCKKDMCPSLREWNDLKIENFGIPKKCKSCKRIDTCDKAIGNFKYLINDVKLYFFKFSLGIGNVRRYFLLLNMLSLIICFFIFFMWGIKDPLYLTNIFFPSQFLIDVWVLKTLKSMNSNLNW